MLLTSILCLPLAVALVCLFARSRPVLAWVNVAGQVGVLALGIKLFDAIIANQGEAVVEWGEFLRADALSAWMVFLVAIVSLSAALYAVRYFRGDLPQATMTERRVRE